VYFYNVKLFLAGERKKQFDQFVKFASVYYVTACLLGDMWQCKIAGQVRS
jgi:hypothetical protein